MMFCAYLHLPKTWSMNNTVPLKARLFPITPIHNVDINESFIMIIFVVYKAD